MSDINCAHCNEPWDIYGLRHDGWEYLEDAQAEQLGCLDLYLWAKVGDSSAQRTVSNTVYVKVLRGKGCPHCGFAHDKPGEHRQRQLEALVIDGVTDDDPIDFF